MALKGGLILRRVLILLTLVLMLTGCTIRSAIRTPPLPNAEADVAKGLLPLGNCTVTVDYVLTESLEKLAYGASWVVEGTVEAMTGTRNLARKGNGPDPTQTIEAVDYRIKVEKYLKGTGPETITIFLTRSHRSRGEERACLQSDFREPAIGSRWVLFLGRSPLGKDVGAPAGYPWRYAVTGDRAVPDLNGGSSPAFPELTVEELAKRVK